MARGGSTFGAFFGGTFGILMAIAFVTLGIPLLLCSGCLGIGIWGAAQLPPPPDDPGPVASPDTTPDTTPDPGTRFYPEPMPEPDPGAGVDPLVLPDPMPDPQPSIVDPPMTPEPEPTPEPPPPADPEPEGHPLRTWTSADGKFTVEARFVKYAVGTVTLEKADGKRVDVPMTVLSREDQDWIKGKR